jgi:hypothetical protein
MSNPSRRKWGARDFAGDQSGKKPEKVAMTVGKILKNASTINR